MNEQVPAGWEFRELQCLAKDYKGSIVDGPFGSNLKISDYTSKGIPVLQGKNITNDKFVWSDVRFISQSKAKELSRSSVRVGDILMVKIGSIGYSAIVDDLGRFDYAIIPANLLKIDINEKKALTKFIHLYLTSPEGKRRIIDKASSTAQPALSLATVKKFRVPLPPLPEQKKIASILTSVDEVIESTQKQIDKFQNLKKATMNELLTKGIGHTEFKDSELGRIPKDWEVAFLGNLGKFAKGKGISKDDISNTGIPCIRYAEIYTDYNYVIRQFRSFISKDKVPTTKRLKKNDIVFAGSGETVEDIGKSVSFVDECEAYVGGDTIVFSPIDSVDSTFLSYQLNDDIRRTQLRKLGQGSSIVHIYSSNLKHLRVCLPPLNEQQKIVSILTSLAEAIEDKQLKLHQTQSLKKSLMQDLLTGKVRVKVN